MALLQWIWWQITKGLGHCCVRCKVLKASDIFRARVLGLPWSIIQTNITILTISRQFLSSYDLRSDSLEKLRLVQEKQAFEWEGLWNQWYVTGYIGIYTLKRFFSKLNAMHIIFFDSILNVRFKGIWNTVPSYSRYSTYFSSDLWVTDLHKLDISVKQILIKK